MKHIILPIMNEPFDDELLFHGLNKDLLKNEYILIVQTSKVDQKIELIKENRMAVTYEIGPSIALEDIFGVVQEIYLSQDLHVQIDIIVDAGGAGRAVSIIRDMQTMTTFSGRGTTASLKIMFLADVRSPGYQDEQVLYNMLKQAVNDAEKGATSLQFNCAYLMIAQNEQQRTLRKKILPYIIQNESLTTKPEIRTCGGQVRDLNLDIDSIESVPKDLATRTVCALLRNRPMENPISVFLMATGVMANKTHKEQFADFINKLEDMVPVQLPSAADLLVQKGSPYGDASTKELVTRFYEDNPHSNPELYNKTETRLLTQLPEVVNAVYDWENEIITQVCEKGDLEAFIDQLRTDSEFDRLLAEPRNPVAMAADKNLIEKDGYTETALQKLDQYTVYLQESLRNAIYAARLRLIRSRLLAMRYRLEKVQQNRKKAVDEKLKASMTKDITELIENWSKDISTKLSNAANQIQLPGEQEDVSSWIDRSANVLMEKIPTPDYEIGRKELADSGAIIISGMRTNTDNRLIPIILNNAVGEPLPERWIVYRQMISGSMYQQTDEPVVVKAAEWYLNLNQCTPMDENLFLKPLPEIVTKTAEERNEAPQDQTSDKILDEADLAPLVRRDKEELDIYNGTLTWIWKDMRYTNARIEVFADTGAQDAMKEPVFIENNILYRSDDRYVIGRESDLPSGVPLLFRIIYLDKGKEVQDLTQEIRMRSPRTRLEVELLSVKEGKILNKKPYYKLKIRSNGSFSINHIAVGSSTGHVYTAAWEQVEDGWLSELLPCCENWQVVERPGDLIEYDIIQ